MSRDYKKMAPKSSPGKKGNPLLTGLMIGLFAGLIIAVGVALYVNHMPSPFTEKTKQQPDTAPEKATKQAPAATGAEPPAASAPDKPSTATAKPRFDFYNILPGSEEPITEQNIKQARQQPTGTEVYYLQAGAFQSENDADNLKAKLALLGIEAVIQTANLPDKGLWHRVRIGPYSNVDEADKVRAALAQNKVNASLIKVKDTPPN